VAGAIAVALGVTGFVATQSANADTAPRRIVNGWLPYWSMSSSLAAVTGNSDLWNEASPFWYTATGATTIVNETGAGDASVVSALRAKGVKVIPSVTETLNGPAMLTLLNNATQRAAHVKMLVDLVTTNGYDGIDLDYETMNSGGGAGVRAGFVTMSRELGAALDAKGKMLSLTVGPRRSATDSNWGVFDYAGLAPSADRFRIMTYDFHWQNGTPGAVAPQAWVDSVIAYAKTVVPAGKIDVGVPLYSYDWPADATQADKWGTAVSRTYAQTEELRVKYNATRLYSATDAAPYFTYTATTGVKHEVWYNDQASTAAKMGLIGKYGLHGLAFWVVGGEDTKQWAPLRSYAIQRSATMTINTPAAVTYGSDQVVTGKLTNVNGVGVAGTKVVLQFMAPGATVWQTFATGNTSSTGAISLKYKNSSNGKYRLYAYQSWTYIASASPAVGSMIRWKATGALAAATVKRNTPVKLSGVVTPPRTGTAVQLQRYLGNNVWSTVLTTKISATGAYSFSWKIAAPNTYTYRAYVPTTTYNASAVSPTVKVKIT